MKPPIGVFGRRARVLSVSLFVAFDAFSAANRKSTSPENAVGPRIGEKQQMAKLQLSFACGLYDRMQPLYTGEVKPDGIDLNFIAIDQPRPIFDRMAGGEEFDVAE